jgi:hypothetical protein
MVAPEISSQLLGATKTGCDHFECFAMANTNTKAGDPRPEMDALFIRGLKKLHFPGFSVLE